MYIGYIMETVAQQKVDETARHTRQAARRTTPAAEPRTTRKFRVPRVTWHRPGVRTA